MRPDRTSVMALVEAAYRPSLTHAAWCDELAAAALAFDQGLGTFVALEGLALPNALAAPGPFELSPRERDVVRWAVDGASNKEAAYALGLSVGGFSAQLTRAMRKLKVHNRSELQVLVMRTRDVSEPSADASAARHGYLAVPLSAPAPADDVRLTDHQRALLALLAEGTSNQTIAERLGISPHTVRNRVAALCTKFGARSRAELVRLFARR